MKKYLILSIINFISIAGIAQLHFNLQAGIITTHNHISNSSVKLKNYTSFDFGINFKKALRKNWISESGIFFNPKGYGFSSTNSPDFKLSLTEHVNYITLNQNFSNQFLNPGKIKFAAGLGGFIAMGLNGKYVEDSYNFGSTQHIEYRIKFGSSTSNQFKSFDAGMNFLFRAGYRKLDFTAMFSPSLTNHSQSKEKLQSFSFNIGYTF